jgi:hypothetical protein
MQRIQPPELGSNLVNEACWKVLEALPSYNPGTFNNLKPAFLVGLTFVLEKLQEEPCREFDLALAELSFAMGSPAVRGKRGDFGTPLLKLAAERFRAALSQAGQGGQGEVVASLGHGHVIPRPDGVKARCGGPAFCQVCQREKAAQPAPVPATERVVTCDITVNGVNCKTLRITEGQSNDAGGHFCEPAPVPATVASAARAWELQDFEGKSSLTYRNPADLNRDYLEKFKSVRALAYIAQQTAPAVPAGWQLVPKEPTREMLLAALDVENASYDNHQHVLCGHWADMLQAAPKPGHGESAAP